MRHNGGKSLSDKRASCKGFAFHRKIQSLKGVITMKLSVTAMLKLEYEFDGDAETLETLKSEIIDQIESGEYFPQRVHGVELIEAVTVK